ncbi:MAG: glyoxalase [Microbacteriaceae bacterium]|nr:glyoxalase [Microbacteriaceae bacterium]
MVSFISHTTVDCADAFTLSTWWKEALGYSDLDDDPNTAGDEECMIRDPATGHSVLFVEVPDAAMAKASGGKNRLHFDIRPRAGTRDSELATLLNLGATTVADHRGIHGPGTGWVVLADPEGNEFCILRSESELSVSD